MFNPPVTVFTMFDLKCGIYLCSLAQRCNERAIKDGYHYFALRFWGECVGFIKLNEVRTSSSECSTGHYKPCPKNHDQECVGKASVDYIYRVC